MSRLTLAVVLALLALVLARMAEAHDPHPIDPASGTKQPVPNPDPALIVRDPPEPCDQICQRELARAHCPPLPVYRNGALLVVIELGGGRCPFMSVPLGG